MRGWGCKSQIPPRGAVPGAVPGAGGTVPRAGRAGRHVVAGGVRAAHVVAVGDPKIIVEACGARRGSAGAWRTRGARLGCVLTAGRGVVAAVVPQVPFACKIK